MEQKQERRRGRYQRSRRGPDRRDGDARAQHTQAQAKPRRDTVDVEQIMRDIRSRIAQRQGVDLSTQQIQDLAARRLESILDPRAIKPSLLNALRRSAGEAPTRHTSSTSSELAFTFEDSTIYDSHRGVLRLIRRLLNPLLKLLFNPNPVIGALHRQARLNAQQAERDADRDRGQTEWNALHYEIVQRLVTEVSRVSLDLKSMAMRIESLDAKLEFNERRVRGIEGSAHRSRPQNRPVEPVAASPVAVHEASPADASSGTAAAKVEGQSPDPVKRRRRRRRGRRPDAPRETARIGEAAQTGERETEKADVAHAPPNDPEDTPAADQLAVAASDASAPAQGISVVQQPAAEPPAQERETSDPPSIVANEPQPTVETSVKSGEATPAILADEPGAGHGER